MRCSRTLLVPAITLIAALLGAACGDDDTTAATDAGAPGERAVDVRMADNDFDPSGLEVERGDTVTFVFENTGAVDHDAFIGDAEAQAEHETEMNSTDSTGSSDMGGEMGDHSAADDDALTVAPGETGELSYTFDEAGELEIGCHEPGHYDSGMKILVTVT